MELAEKNAELAEEISGLIAQVRQQARREAALKRQLTQYRRDDPRSADIERVLATWVRLLAKPKNTSITLTGKRADAVRQAMDWNFTRDDLLGMLEGLRKFPFVVYGERKATGTKTQRRDDILDALRDEGTIETLIQLGSPVREAASPSRAPRGVRPALPELPSESQLREWKTALFRNAKVVARLMELKGWTGETLYDLGIGWDERRKRLVFPIHGPDGHLQTIALYRPNGAPKMQAVPGRPRGLFPAPEFVQPGEDIWVVEGEPDAVTGYRLGLAAIGVPGVNAWRDEWAPRFAGRRVVVCFDCDEPGRKAASGVATALVSHASEVRVVDLGRADGFDLTDFALAGGTAEQLRFLAAAAAPITGPGALA